MTPLPPAFTALAAACLVTAATAGLTVPTSAPAARDAAAPDVGQGPAGSGCAAAASSGGTVTSAAGPRRCVTVPEDTPGAGIPAGTLARTPAGAPAGTALARPTGGYGWPLAGVPPVLRGFAPGPHPWSRGHRGVDLAGDDGAPVLAAGAGTVTFAGVIAGRGVVVVQHGAGLRTTYEPVAAVVPAGSTVRAGQQVGTLQGGVRHCTPGPCLHWGARIGDGYLDPLLLLRGRPRPAVLLPIGEPPG